MQIWEFRYAYLFYYFTLFIEIYIVILVLSSNPYTFISEHSLQIYAKRVSPYFLSILNNPYINSEIYLRKEIHLVLNICRFLVVWTGYKANTTQGHEGIINIILLPPPSYYFGYLIFQDRRGSFLG